MEIGAANAAEMPLRPGLAALVRPRPDYPDPPRRPMSCFRRLLLHARARNRGRKQLGRSGGYTLAAQYIAQARVAITSRVLPAIVALRTRPPKHRQPRPRPLLKKRFEDRTWQTSRPRLLCRERLVAFTVPSLCWVPKPTIFWVSLTAEKMGPLKLTARALGYDPRLARGRWL